VGEVAAGEPLGLAASGRHRVDVADGGVVRAVEPAGGERDPPGRPPVGVHPGDVLEGAAAVRVVEPPRVVLGVVEVDDEEVRRHLVRPADAVQLMLEPRRLDRPALSAHPIEVVGLLVGRVARLDHQPVAVGRPVEVGDALVALGDLSRVAAQGEVEQPHLRLRLVVAGGRVLVSVLGVAVGLGVLVVLPVPPSDSSLGVAVAGGHEREAVAVRSPRRRGGAGRARQAVRLARAVGRDDEQRAHGLVRALVVLGGGEGDAVAGGGNGDLADLRQVVVGVERQCRHRRTERRPAQIRSGRGSRRRRPI
jgi:hypothetical protein